MRTRNLAWWRQRVRGVRKIFHVFRIDHVLGFYRIYAFPWRPERNPEFLPLSGMRCATGPAGRFRSSIRATIPHGRTAKRIAGKAKSTCARSWRRRGIRAWSVKTLGPCRTMSGRACIHWAWRLQDSAMGELRRRPIIPGSEYQACLGGHLCDPRPQTSAGALAGSGGEIEPGQEQARRDLAKIAEFAGIPPPEKDTV